MDLVVGVAAAAVGVALVSYRLYAKLFRSKEPVTVRSNEPSACTKIDESATKNLSCNEYPSSGSWIGKEDREEKLRMAAFTGNQKEIISLLNEGTQIDVADQLGRTAMICAVLAGHIECVQLLLDKGAQINFHNHLGQTALMHAVSPGHTQLLIDKGAQINDRDMNGETLFIQVTPARRVACVKLLIDMGAQVNHQDNNGQTPLIHAISSGHIACVKLLIDMGAQVNHRDKVLGQTALQYAVSAGHTDCIQLLLDKGAQINDQDKYGQTLLMQAISAGHVACVKMLLDMGAQVNNRDKLGRTAMTCSISAGRIECMQLLLDKGVDINENNEYGQTLLMQAISAGHVACVKMLLDMGAQVNHRDKLGQTAMTCSISAGRIECMQLLLDKGVDINENNEHGQTLLMQATSARHVACVKMLLDMGAQVNHRDKILGQTALQHAVSAGYTDCIQLLLDKGAQINDQDKLGRTAMSCSISAGHIECMQLLLDKGAEINDQNQHGQTLLIQAASAGHVAPVKMLLDMGAQVNHRDQFGQTAIMHAVSAGHTECIQCLLDKGAQINDQDKNGQTLLIKATSAGQVEFVRVLLKRGAQVNHRDKLGLTALMYAVRAGHIECMQLLLNKGAQINDQDMNGETLLIKATSAGHFACVKLLIDMGAQVNHRDEIGRTALMCAVSGRIECVQLLLDKGAQINNQDKVTGLTPLMMASSTGHVECVQLLLDRGAQVNHQNMMGNTALHEAASRDQSSCVRALLSHPGIDVNIKNTVGHTAMMVAGYSSLGVFKEIKTCKDFPVDSYGKVVLCGNSGAGKSTLTQAIINFSKPMAKPLRLLKRVFGLQIEVEPLTAGIIPHQVDSSDSNMIIYDLAGHHQYFSSHSACLEAISLNSPAIFLLLQDLRHDPDAMTKEVYYWSTMIDGVCHKCPQQSSVIVVGTHADLLTPEQLTKKITLLESLAREAISHQKLVTVLALNVAKGYSEEMDEFKNELCTLNGDVVHMSPSIPIMCHMILAFLKQKIPDPDVDAISLSDLIAYLQADKENLIDPDSTKIIPILNTLSEKGLILFIPSKDPLNSWIVLHKESILRKVNGALFADPSLKEFVHVASNTGIVPIAVIKKIFPEYNIEMITQFMIHFELCQAVELSQMDTNMAPEGSSSSDLGPLLFFPALVSIRRPISAAVPSNSFGWAMVVKSPNQFFTTRFLHVLLRRLPSEFALPEPQATPLHSRLNRKCDVWSTGIKWLNETGVTIIVEMSDTFQSLSLAMSSPDRECGKYISIAHAVLAVIKAAHEEFCPHLDVVELVSCPPETCSDYSNNTMVQLFSLRKALLEGDKNLTDMSGKKYVVMEKWMKIEPRLPCLVGVNFPVVPSSSSSLSSEQLLPLKVSSPLILSALISQAVVELEGTPTLQELLSFSDRKVNITEQIGVDYLKFGIFLLGDSAIVKALENEHQKNAERINLAIFQKWLDGKGVKPVTWSTLVTVLQNIHM